MRALQLVFIRVLKLVLFPWWLIDERIHLPIKEMQVWSLCWEDPLKKEVATHSSILVWEIPWSEESGGLQTMGLQRVKHNWATKKQQIIVNFKVTFKLYLHFLGIDFCLMG